jgi:hypothetical protein
MKRLGPWLVILLLLLANGLSWLWLSGTGLPWGWGPRSAREPERLEQMVRPEALVPHTERPSAPAETAPR